MPDTEYLTAETVKIGDNQFLIKIKGVLDDQAKLISLTVPEFQAVYRMVFRMIQEELEKSGDKPQP